MLTVSAEQALELIYSDNLPPELKVRGRLSLKPGWELKGRLPDTLHVTALDISGCTNLKALPKTLRCYELSARNISLESLPDDWHVEYRLDLSDCHHLKSLPEGLTVGSLILQNCTALRALPESLNVNFLDISRCTSLTTIPESVMIQHGSLITAGCTRLTTLPPQADLSMLNIEGCRAIVSLPDTLQVHARLELAGSGLTSLPDSMRKIELVWRSARVSYDIVFHPETITSKAVMDEINIEVRRAMLERMGYERFLKESQAEKVDQDTDLGGVRLLLRIALPSDEPLVCVSYFCPSTGRQYVTRVPPNIQTCRQAVAWIGGFDNPDDYKLIAEG